MPREPIKDFDIALSKQLEIILIEQVRMNPFWDHNTKVRALKSRESYWQGQFNTLECNGGLNKRDSKLEIRKNNPLGQ